MATSLLSIDAQQFSTYFNRKPFLIWHRLGDHPLFQMDRLLKLAQALPESLVEYNAGTVEVNQKGKETPRTGLSAEETLRRVAEHSAWMVLKHVERDGEYGALLNRCLDEIEPHSSRLVPNMQGRAGFIFISSPNAVTPFHMDPEHNFLLQVRGSKRIAMWDPWDRFVISEGDLEDMYARDVHRNLAYRNEFEQTAFHLHLESGSGLHFPVHAPHWVKNEGEVSVSFSITFRSDVSQERVMLYRANANLRRLGLAPFPIGLSPLRDRSKALAYRTWIGAKRLGRRLTGGAGRSDSPGPSRYA